MLESVVNKKYRWKLKRNIDADVAQKPGELLTLRADKMFCNEADFFFFFKDAAVTHNTGYWFW